MATRLNDYEGPCREYREGQEVRDELFELISERIPEMHPSDPVRIRLAELAPHFGNSLGRPRVAAVNGADR
jgi:hypothetical protein